MRLSAARPVGAPLAALLRRSAIVGGVGSLLIHLSVLVSIVSTAIPSVDFALTFPMEVELGLTDATEVAMGPAAPPEPADPPLASEGAADPASAAAGRLDGSISLDAGVSDGGITDGGPPDAGRRRRRDAGVDAPAPLVATEEGTAAGGPGDAGTSPVAFLPAGAQVALRVDLDRVRASEVREDVEALLAALPDWEALLEGSGVDPVRDFSRVLVATPNFDRARIVVAGRLSAEARSPREVAATMARAHGERLEWSETGGVPTARWVTPDATPRRVAIVGPRHFVVASDDDLERVLAIAAARSRSSGATTDEDEGEGDDADDDDSSGADDRPADLHPADALLSMGEGEALTLEIEGARRFIARSPCPIPGRARLALREAASGVDVVIVARFDDGEEASRADRCYRRYVGLGRALFPPLAPLLGRLETSIEETVLTLTSSMTFDELRALLSLITERFATRRASPAPPVPASGPEEGAAPPPEPSPSPPPEPGPVPG